MLKLIKGGKVYAPQNLGEMDILMGGTKVLAVAPNIDLPANIESTVFDATGKTVIPGLIDSHVHLIGAGGGEGPTSRTHEIDITTIAKAGLTTVVGTLGIDTVSFGFCIIWVTTYSWKSSNQHLYVYRLPAAAVTIQTPYWPSLDPLNKIVVVKIALFDSLSVTRARKSWPQLATKVMLGGRLGAEPRDSRAHRGTQGTCGMAEMLKYMGLPAPCL